MPRDIGMCKNLSSEQRKRSEKEGRKPSYRFKIHPHIIDFEDLIRGALTGMLHGPELDKIFVVLGKDSALKRLKNFYA